MTPVTESGRSLDPTLAQRWRRWRFPLAVVASLILLAVVLTVVSGQTQRGYLDPDGINAGGARALVRLLDDQGVEVTPVRTLDNAVDATGSSDTLLVTEPDRLLPEQVERLVATGADIVLIAPEDIDRFAPELFVAGQSREQVIEPDCDLPAATRAGDARLGGIRYDGPDDATACYAVDGAATLIVGDTPDGGRIVAFGTSAPLTNRHLDQDGNAALVMGILGENARLTWYRPTVEPADQEPRSFAELMPDWVGPAIWQLAIAAALTAWWRARRFGPVVAERLPVVVRAAEATEGRARLYRRGRSRGHAAAMLRAAATGRLRQRLGVPDSVPASVVADGVSARTGRPPDAVAALLNGPDPVDDAALVRLADELDELEREVRTL